MGVRGGTTVPSGIARILRGSFPECFSSRCSHPGAVELEVHVGQGVREDDLGVVNVRGGERVFGEDHGEDLGDERGPGTDHLVKLPTT